MIKKEKLIKLNSKVYCLKSIDNSKEFHIPGQGIYVWVSLDQLKDFWNGSINEKDIRFKIGQFGANAVNGKIPQETIAAERDNFSAFSVIVYSKNIDNAFQFEHSIHKTLNKNTKAYNPKDLVISKESFVNTSFDEIKKIIINLSSGVNNKTMDFNMRPEQKLAHDKIIEYFNSGGVEFLLAAKMRFGKNFTILNSVKTLGYKRVLFTTYKPTVFKSLEDDINSHINFKDFEIIDLKTTRAIPQYNGKTQIITSSAQLALHKDIDDPTIKKSLNILKDVQLDLIVADEYHYGTKTNNFKSMLSELSYNKIIYVSGTAMRDINIGRFVDEQIYSWSYMDEQEQKKNGSKAHYDMPTMNIHTMYISNEIKDNQKFYLDDEGFTMTKIIATNSNGTLKDPASLEILLKQIAGTVGHKQMSPYRIVNGLEHTFWVLPKNTAGIIAMSKLMKRMPEYEGYEILAATGGEISDIEKVKDSIKKFKRTITLSCYRFKEGTTVPEWNGVFMLDDGKSQEEYLQAIFRSQSPDRENDKQNCYVFDFNPQRCLQMVYDTCENLDKDDNKNLSDTIREFLDYCPLLDHYGNKMVEVNSETIIDNFYKNGNWSTKFSNEKQVYFENINDDIIKSLISVKQEKFKSNIDINDNGILLGKNFKPNKKRNKIVLTKGEKDKIEEIKRKVRTVLSTIPNYLFITPEIEEDVNDILKSNRADLFKECTGIFLDDFKLWVDTGFINTIKLSRNILSFGLAEKKGMIYDKTLSERCERLKKSLFFESSSTSTPLSLVNEMLDTLPKEVWSDKNLKWLDPCCGLGTFMVAIHDRLMVGLKHIIKNENKRSNHIIENMLFGYDNDNKKVLISKKFLNYNNRVLDNIYIKDSLINEKDNMKFDIVIGNPPYQETIAKLGQAKPIYNKFVEKYIDQCEYMLFITPSRWFAGGMGLDSYRKMMQNRTDIKIIKHYSNEKIIFGPNINIRGGVSYFLIDKNYNGNPELNGEKNQLNKYDIIIPDADVHSIIDKVLKFEGLNTICTNQCHFGITVNDKRFLEKETKTSVKCYVSKVKGFERHVKKSDIKNIQDIDKWKVCTPIAYGTGDQDAFGNIYLVEPGAICSESYKVFLFDNRKNAENFKMYLETKFSFFLMALRKNSQNMPTGTYKWIPLVDFNETWSDEKLYKKFKLTKEEIQFIEKVIPKYY